MRIPAMPFMMFQGPDIVHRFSTTPPCHRPKLNTWKSRTTASAMLTARMSGGKHSAQRFSYRWCVVPSAPRHFTKRSAMKPKQPASAEYVFTQLNHVPVPYSLPGAAVMGHTKTVSTMGTTANSAMPAHSDVRPNSLNAISANKMNSQMTQYSGSAAWYRIPMMKPPSLPRFPPLPGGSSDTWPSSHRRRTAP